MATTLQTPLAQALDAVAGDWQPPVRAFAHGPVGEALCRFVDGRVAAGAAVYPPQPMRALHATPLDLVRVVILGQDPYHGAGQAEGLAFSVPHGVRAPPSLRNIFKELQRDLGLAPPASPSLLPWAERGVLLLNATLTVEDGAPAAHARRGWEVLTDALVASVAARPVPVAFLLWGASAQAKAPGIAERGGGRHLVLCANHPSPLSAMRPPVPFIGCGHFGRAAAFLAGQDRPIDWALASAESGARDRLDAKPNRI